MCFDGGPKVKGGLYVFIVTAKLRPKRLAVGLLALCLICAAVMGVLPFPASAAVSSVPDPKGVKTNEDRVAYLEKYGWLVAPEPLAVEQLLIPKEFDPSYDDYLALQASQGFNLTRYQGKKVTRCSYEVLNYPTGENGVQAALLLYKNTVIGGEVLSSQLDGFIHGLSFPEE